jgi:alginate O-acetyltransferase complex protein AlgJ
MAMRPSLLSLIILLGAPLTLAASSGALVSPGPKPIIAGEWQLAFEKNFDKKLVLREAALATWGNAQYALFREGREGVLIGEQGWLFSSEEFSQSAAHKAELAHKLELITQIKQQLAAQNIGLIVALIPDKSRIYPEYLGRHKKPGALEGRYTDFLARLQAVGITAPDLQAVLAQGKSTGQMFLRTDTHWTPAGALQAARALAAAAPAYKGSLTFTSSQSEQLLAHEGDLLNFIPLGPLAAHYGLQSEPLAKIETMGSSESGDLFGESVIAGALIGTSYSANEKWNFLGALKQVFGQDFINVAADGKGPLIPMQDYLKSASFKNSPPQFIIWDIPERFLGVTYHDTPTP